MTTAAALSLRPFEARRGRVSVHRLSVVQTGCTRGSNAGQMEVSGGTRARFVQLLSVPVGKAESQITTGRRVRISTQRANVRTRILPVSARVWIAFLRRGHGLRLGRSLLSGDTGGTGGGCDRDIAHIPTVEGPGGPYPGPAGVAERVGACRRRSLLTARHPDAL